MSRLSLALAVLAVAPLLSAQRTWVVDDDPGVGVDFTDLPAAFAAVADGDTVIVRAGFYSPAALTAGIRLVGEPLATVVMPFGTSEFVVANIGAGRHCSIRGLRIGFLTAPGFVFATVRISNCAGSVVLDDMTIELQSVSGALVVASCAGVSISNSLIRSMTSVENSTLNATGCTFRAYDDAPISNGLSAFRSHVELTQCSVFGSNGGGHSPAASAVRAWESTLVVRGDSTSQYVAGEYFVGSTPIQSAESIDGNGTSTLQIDPAVSLSVPAVGVSTESRRLPFLLADLDAVNLSAELHSPAGDAWVVAASVPNAPLDASPFGTFWLLPSASATLGSGTQGLSEVATVQIARVVNPAVVGLPLIVQGASLGARLDLTNPSALVVD